MTTNTLHTPRFLLPVPTWNADWQKWQQVFETFAKGVDSTMFSLLEHSTLIPRVLPTVSITGGVFSQSGPAQFISRTLQVEVSVGPNPLTLVPRALVCAHLQSGAVGPQSIEWEIRITNTEVDADLVVFGVVGDDYSITWYNGAKLTPGTSMSLFAFEGGGGGGLSPAPFDFILEPTLLTPEQNGQYFLCINGGGGYTASVTLPANPTPGMQFTIGSTWGDIVIYGNGYPIAGSGDFGDYNIILRNQALVTLTAKPSEPLEVGLFAWMITSGIGKIASYDYPDDVKFDFNFNMPYLDVMQEGYFLGYDTINEKIIRFIYNPYNLRRGPLRIDFPGSFISVDRTNLWSLYDSGYPTTTSDPITYTFASNFSLADADDGWKVTFRVGTNNLGDVVPVIIRCPGTDENLCIGDAPRVNLISSNDVGAFVTVHYFRIHPLSRGSFVVLEGRGTWTDNLGGIHNLSGGSSGGVEADFLYWDQTVAGGTNEVGSVVTPLIEGIGYSLKVECIAGTPPSGADLELSDAPFAGSHEVLYQIGLTGGGLPRYEPSINPTWIDRNPFGFEGLTGAWHWRLTNLGGTTVTFRVTLSCHGTRS